MARITPEASTALAIQIGGIYVALRFGQDGALHEWVPAVCRGEAVSAVALTEPEVGSDLAAMAMPAVQEPGGWRLLGSKVWIMRAPGADIYTVFARTLPDAGAAAPPRSWCRATLRASLAWRSMRCGLIGSVDCTSMECSYLIVTSSAR